MLKILGNRILVSRVEEPQTEGFSTVEIQDSFVFKGKVEDIGQMIFEVGIDKNILVYPFVKGSIIYFRKYSPDTEEIEHEGKKMKVVSLSDVIAIL